MSEQVSASPAIHDPEEYVFSRFMTQILDYELCQDEAARETLYAVYRKMAAQNTSRPRTIFGTSLSCGVSYLSGLGQPPESIVNKVLKERHDMDKNIREAFVVFSDVNDPHDGTNYQRAYGGNALCRYIRENNLGQIMDMSARKNPNSGNMIKVWVWAPPHESLEKADRYMPIAGKELTFTSFGDPVYRDKPVAPFKNPSAFAKSSREA